MQYIKVQCVELMLKSHTHTRKIQVFQNTSFNIQLFSLWYFTKVQCLIHVSYFFKISYPISNMYPEAYALPNSFYNTYKTFKISLYSIFTQNQFFRLGRSTGQLYLCMCTLCMFFGRLGGRPTGTSLVSVEIDRPGGRPTPTVS